RGLEGQLPQPSTSDPLEEITLREAQARLHEELARLPERLRVPLVLCYLEGRTRDEAARQLGWSLATLKRRLERGRNILRTRLEPGGPALSAGLLAGLAASPSAPAAMPPTLAAVTAKAAALAVQGGAIEGAVSAAVAGLMQQGLPAVFTLKWNLAAAIVLVVG